MATVRSQDVICRIVEHGILVLETEAGYKPVYYGILKMQGMLVVVDWSERNLQVYNGHDGKLITSHRLESYPMDVCRISKNEVAVCLWDGTVVILSLKSIDDVKLVKTLQTGFDYGWHSLAKWNSDKLIISGKKRDGKDFMLCWGILSIRNGRIYSIHLCEGYRTRMAVKDNTVYISCLTSDSINRGVHVYDILNPKRKKFLYQHQELNEPWSIMADRDYVYVCDRDSNRIHQLTDSGQLVTIHTVSSRLDEIFYDDQQRLLYTTNIESNVITVYKMESLHKPDSVIPAEVLNMDTRSLQMYKEALNDGKEKVYNIRVMVVGQYGVGKTTLTQRLLGKNVNISERHSTDGIDVHVECSKVSLPAGEWTTQEKKSPEKDVASEKQESDATIPSSGTSTNYGIKLTVEELFQGAKQHNKSPSPKAISMAMGSAQGQPQPGHGSTQALNHQRPGSQQKQQQSVAQHLTGQPLLQGHLNPPPAGYQSDHQQQHHQPAHKHNQQGHSRNPVVELAELCQSMNLVVPKYDCYPPKNGKYSCVVTLDNGARFQGSWCRNKEEAAKSAAGVVLLHLKTHVQPILQPLMMPGYLRSRLPPPTQFSSPNSAFSPVIVPLQMAQQQGYKAMQQFFRHQRGQFQNYRGNRFNLQQYPNPAQLQQGMGQLQHQVSQKPECHGQTPHLANQTQHQQPSNQGVTQGSYNQQSVVPNIDYEGKVSLEASTNHQTEEYRKHTPEASDTLDKEQKHKVAQSQFVPLQVTRRTTPNKTKGEKDPGKTTPKSATKISSQTSVNDNNDTKTMHCDESNNMMDSGSNADKTVAETNISKDFRNKDFKAEMKTCQKLDSCQPKEHTSKTPKRRLAANLNFKS